MKPNIGISDKNLTESIQSLSVVLADAVPSLPPKQFIGVELIVVVKAPELVIIAVGEREHPLESKMETV